jgi:hypothetical protein
VNKKEVEDHVVASKVMNWDELVDTILDLTLEKEELKSYLTKKAISDYDKVISIYEDEKFLRAQETSQYIPYEVYETYSV